MDNQQRIEKAIKEKNERIDQAIKKKEFRQTKTEVSIGFRWSVNVAVAFLPEKLRGTEDGFNQLKKWQLKFEGWDREVMIENTPIESISSPKLTRQDFAQATAEAPKSQADEDRANEAREELKREEEQQKVEEIPTTEDL